MTAGIDPTKAIRRAFPEMSRVEAAAMVALGEVQTYPEGKVLCREGAIESVFYVMLEGQVKISKHINQEEERFLCNMDPGDFFGEMALIHNAPRAASVVTTQASTVLEISKVAFDDLVRRNTSVSVAMVREVSRRLRENNDLAIEDLRMKAGELAIAYQQLAEMEYARSKFLTVAAHELRTPLSVANGFLHMIRTQRIQGEALYSALDTVSRNLEDITALVNDILFLQEMDIILPEFQLTDIGAVMTAVVEHECAQAEAGQVGLSLYVPSNLPRVSADAKSLERALTAIVENAIKFSPEGGDVYVRLGFDEEQIWIEVEDHGVGIPPEYMDRVFERFFHLEEVGGHLFRGVGLGLSIARQVVDLHRGRIEARSNLGQGSTFTVRLYRK